MNKKIVGLIIGLCVVLVGIGVFVASRGNKAKPEATIEILATDHVIGRTDAAVTLVEYADFQCPSCGAYYPIIKQLEKDYPDDLRVVFRHFPLTSIHANSWAAATFSEAAASQNKFWEVYAKLFEKQEEWSTATKIETVFEAYAKELGLDFEKIKKDMYDSGVLARIKRDQESGDALGISGTPTFFVNGEKIALPGGVDQFKKIIDGELAKKQVVAKVHKHFDLAVYVDGKKFDLSNDKYMEKNEGIHMHDNNGEVVHIHKNGVSIFDFLKSLGLGWESKKPYALNVNGVPQDLGLEDYYPSDLDRVILQLGTSNVLSGVKDWGLFVTDKACIYSETCPERGKPPTEKCVGGVGSDCIEKKE